MHEIKYTIAMPAVGTSGRKTHYTEYALITNSNLQNFCLNTFDLQQPCLYLRMFEIGEHLYSQTIADKMSKKPVHREVKTFLLLEIAINETECFFSF